MRLQELQSLDIGDYMEENANQNNAQQTAPAAAGFNLGAFLVKGIALIAVAVAAVAVSSAIERMREVNDYRNQLPHNED